MRQRFAKKKEEDREDDTQKDKLQFGGALLGPGHAPGRRGSSGRFISFVPRLTEVLGGGGNGAQVHHLPLLALPLLNLPGKLRHLPLHLLLLLPDFDLPLAHGLQFTSETCAIEIQRRRGLGFSRGTRSSSPEEW